ncbi:MAG: TetR/AcrR family transcriptional regulator [Alistipes onderdonkii]
MTPPQKERIIDQAMHMFVSQGIKSVRMDDIAQQLGVSKRTLYEMFGDKEGLLYLAMERYSERNRQRWNELTADAHDVLEAMFMVLGEVMDNAEVSRRMMDNLKKFYPAVHDKLMRRCRRICSASSSRPRMRAACRPSGRSATSPSPETTWARCRSIRTR